MDPNSSQPPAPQPQKSSASLDEILDSLQNQIASTQTTPSSSGPTQIPNPLAAPVESKPVQSSDFSPVSSAQSLSSPAQPTEQSQPLAPQAPVAPPSQQAASQKPERQFAMEEKHVEASTQPPVVQIQTPTAPVNVKEDPGFAVKEIKQTKPIGQPAVSTTQTQTTEKKGFQLPFAFSPKVAIAAFGLFIAVVGAVAAVNLSQTSQDIRQYAAGQAGCGPCGCGNCNFGTSTNPVCKNNQQNVACAASGCQTGQMLYCNNGSFACRTDYAACPTPAPPTSGGGTGSSGGTTTGPTCQNNSSKIGGYVVYKCPNGCVKTVESGVEAWRCYEGGQFVGANDNPTLAGACGQIDELTSFGNTGTFCGIKPGEYTCGESRCQPANSTPVPTPTPPPVTGTPIPQPACGAACTTEEFCDAAVVYLVPKYLNDTAKYAVLDKITVGSTTMQENSSNLTYFNAWASYGPAAGYLDGATTIRYSAGISGGTATWIAFYVNGPSFTVYTDKGPNRGGYDVFINGKKMSNTGLENLYLAGDGNPSNISNYKAYNATVTVPEYDATKYACTTVGTAKQCRLTNNPTSATCVAASPSPSPTSTPTTPPLVCLQLTKDVASPVLGSSVRFTCGQVSQATSYQFRYKVGTGQEQTLGTSTSSSNVSQPLTISAGGTYKVQCRPCVGTACTQWENW